MIWLLMLIGLIGFGIWLLLIWQERKRTRHMMKDFTGRVLCKLCAHVWYGSYCHHPDNVIITSDLDIRTKKYCNELNTNYDCKNHRAIWQSWFYKRWMNLIQHQYKL